LPSRSSRLAQVFYVCVFSQWQNQPNVVQPAVMDY
jgi:hypothetical protein